MKYKAIIPLYNKQIVSRYYIDKFKAVHKVISLLRIYTNDTEYYDQYAIDGTFTLHKNDEIVGTIILNIKH